LRGIAGKLPARASLLRLPAILRQGDNVGKRELGDAESPEGWAGMKKVAAVIGALLALIIAGALIAPFFIDLNDYKPQIAAQAKALTGRDLAIDGDISLSLLPMPGVSV
jgi:hypothetical protein